MNNKGFTLMEVISAFAVLMIIAAALLPQLSQLRVEQYNLSLERKAVLMLHNELIFQQDTHPASEGLFITEGNFTMNFEYYIDYIEGCTSWRDFRDDKKEVCLYSPR
ncbi:type II secretion system GspH family protein [Halobacillus sp. A1]|uniref:prepilin-type N-terminal cleavage/methylation domain-containing protein n=1 Tax=Halobacillus sp. A1 TaxID=2880262 RepID=UPI0020A62502|nr:prepilin-type N-terminal cleavage/methylation domain-containing protein [Halobacillus sp. A1]MCP3030302.1 type II secretion system GspH family protein [Halobacillus sp. A1]